MQNTAKELIKEGTEILRSHFISHPYLNSRIIYEYISKLTQEEIFIKNPIVTKSQKKKFLLLINRRVKLEPLAYIIENKEFYSLNFYVNKKVLIPRPETEIIIDQALKYFSLESGLSILDYGTGSGCIIITLLKFFLRARGIGIDISSSAINIAQKNAALHHVQDRLILQKSDWHHYDTPEKFDLIVANPPYIPINEYEKLQADVKNFEPKQALTTTFNGLSAYKAIAKNSHKLLKNEGVIIIEFGYNQAHLVKNIFLKNGWFLHKIIDDLSNIPRIGIFKNINST